MTTNYENSKKLAEIGFKASFQCGFYKGKPDYIRNLNSKFVSGVNFPSYDLETLLDALPTSVEGMVFGLEKTMIGYGNTKTFKIYEEVGNESLADTAARLLITLAEQKIITFK